MGDRARTFSDKWLNTAGLLELRMILNIGVRTTDPMLVAHREMGERENDAVAMAGFLTELTRKGARLTDTTIFVYHEPSRNGQKRELLVPVASEVEGVETKTLQPMKVAFIVFTGAGNRLEEHYGRLMEYVRHNHLKPVEGIQRIEVHYAPEDMDESDWTMEIMIPLTA
jgi:effector-binding domain-containing protein